MNYQNKKFILVLLAVSIGLFGQWGCTTAPSANNAGDSAGSGGATSSTTGTVAVTGEFSTSLKLKGPSRSGANTNGYSILALKPDGTSIESTITLDGIFALDLPTNAVYTIYLKSVSAGATNVIAIYSPEGSSGFAAGAGTNMSTNAYNIGLIDVDFTNSNALAAIDIRDYIDNDQDGIVDSTDTDDDGDGVLDVADYDSTGRGVPDFFGVLDRSGSGMPDVLKKILNLTNIADADNDGVLDLFDLYPSVTGTNGASILNNASNQVRSLIISAVAADKNIPYFKQKNPAFWSNRIVEFALDNNNSGFRDVYKDKWTNYVSFASDQVLTFTNGTSPYFQPAEWSNYVVNVSMDTNIEKYVPPLQKGQLSNFIITVSVNSQFSNLVPSGLKNQWSNRIVAVTVDPKFTNLIQNQPGLLSEWSNKTAMVTMNSNFISAIPTALQQSWTNQMLRVAMDTNFVNVMPPEYKLNWSNTITMVAFDPQFTNKIPPDLQQNWSNQIQTIIMNPDFSNFIQPAYMNQYNTYTNNPVFNPIADPRFKSVLEIAGVQIEVVQNIVLSITNPGVSIVLKKQTPMSNITIWMTNSIPTPTASGSMTFTNFLTMEGLLVSGMVRVNQTNNMPALGKKTVALLGNLTFSSNMMVQYNVNYDYSMVSDIISNIGKPLHFGQVNINGSNYIYNQDGSVRLP